jgi:hypothetical protein
LKLILDKLKHIVFKGKRQICLLLVFFAIFNCQISYSQNDKEEALKKQAEKNFEDEEYSSAYKQFSQLVSLYPKDPNFNYKLGVCMLYTEPDKTKPYTYLQLAVKNPKDAPKDALFYLAKTYHINYRFDEALKLYADYKKTASSASIKKLQVDNEIQACKNGKRLLSNMSDLSVLSKKQLNAADYFKAYDVKDIGGKLLVKPDDYKTNLDKKKKDRSIVYLPKSGERLYYSSFGDNGNTGRDIYFVNKLPNGTWSKPQMLPMSVNTEFDEDYPFLHPNGKTLYFSSKGHNSMGGYDVFKTTYSPETQTWSKPENLEFPINSPDDDILFVTDSLEQTAYFSTGRYSPYGKIDVLKINTERKPLNFAVLKGTILKEDVSQSVKSKITVKNIANGETVGTFQAQENGEYNMLLPNGGKFIFTVETPNVQTQSEGVQLPVAYSLKPYKQSISYEKKVLKITNYFDGNIDDDNYSLMLDLIEKKAKLDVNQNEQTQPTIAPENLSSVTTTNPTINSETTKTETESSKNLTNEQLLEIAKTDSKEANDESIQLKQEAKDAFGLATQKTAEAAEKQKEADAAQDKLSKISDPSKKDAELQRINGLRNEAKTASDIANIATNLAKKLEVDATIQQKEAELTNQYINQLETVIKNKNNKEALAKLEQIQKELDGVTKQKNQSDELYQSLKAESELKQQELTSSEKKSNALENEINILKTESSNLEKDLAEEKDKSLKDNIASQIKELTTEIEQKNKDLETNNQKNITLKNELEGVNQEISIAAKILNEKTDIVASNTTIDNNSQKPIVNQQSNLLSPTTNTTNSPEKLIIDAESLSKTAYNKRKEASLKTGAEKDALIKEAIEIEKAATNNKIQAAEIYQVQNKTKFENNELNLAELQKTTSDAKSNEISQAKVLIDEASISFKQAQKIREEAKTYPSDAAKLGGFSNAEEKEFEAIAKQQQAVDILSKSNPVVASNDPTSETTTTPTLALNSTEGSKKSAERLIGEAESLNKLAYDKRKEASTKKGSEKDKLLKEAIANEKVATDKKLQASSIYQQENKSKFETSDSNITQLQKSITDQTNTEYIEANTLASEANIAFSQAQKMRTEANNNPSDAAKLGEISNAEEKEFEAIAKQQKALDLFSKIAATQKVEPVQTSNEPIVENNKPANDTKTEVIANTQITNSVTNNNQPISETKTEPNANKTEGKPNTESLLSESENLTKKASDLRKEAESKSGIEKETLLTQANENEKAADDIKLEVAAINQNTNKESFNNKTATFEDLKNKIGTTNSVEITEANTLNSEAAISFSQAKKMREEAEANPSITARLGEISNAEEKEFEAIAKQQKALDLLTKANNNIDKTNNTPVLSNNATETKPKTAIVAQTTNTVAPAKQTTTSTTANINNEIATLNNNLNNNEESDLVNFNAYTSSEAISLKEQATEKINAAIKSDNEIKSALATINTTESSNQADSVVSQNVISNLVDEADKFNDEAYALRKAASTKTGEEKEKDLAEALKLENNASTQKMEAATKQKSLNANRYENNKLNLEELAKLAAGKNISELSTADMVLNEANLTWNQAEKIRTEADSYPNNSAKLGGYNNAEEKEALSLAKQQAVLDIYQKYFQNYVPKNNTSPIANPNNVAALNSAKESFNSNTATHIAGLALMNQAIDKEYKALLSNIPSNLNKANNTLKANAQASYKKNQTQLAKANQTKDQQSKKSFLIEANTAGQEAINFLNQINVSQPEIVTATKPINTTPKPTTNTNPTKPTTPVVSKPVVNKPVVVATKNIPVAKQATITKLKADGLDVKPTNAYTADKPIPVDEKLPEGLVFKVQIGAFKAPLPNNTFKGLTPIIAQTTSSGYIRYMAGDFKQFTSANNVKEGLQDLGYKDAFVVAYFNGKRITISEANDLAKNSASKNETTSPINNGVPEFVNLDLTQKDPVKTNTVTNETKVPEFVNIDFTKPEATKTNTVTTETKVPEFVNIDFTKPEATKTNTVTTETKVPEFVNIDFGDTLGAKTVAKTETKPIEAPTNNGINDVTDGELEKMNGLLYTIQIGIYSKEVTKDQLYNLKPIYTEKLPNGLYRYTAGIYNQTAKLLIDKKKAVDFGLKDAFVTAYYNGQRITLAEGQKIQSENNNLKVEDEKPIILPNGNITTVTQPTKVENTANVNSQVTPFTNNVIAAPIPTNENGVKADEAGISFRVQIGAYKNQVPTDVASKFSNIKNWPIKYAILNNLFIYHVGNFSGLSFAKKLKEEMISIGITDAYITVYKDGKKLYGAEALQYLQN